MTSGHRSRRLFPLIVLMLLMSSSCLIPGQAARDTYIGPSRTAVPGEPEKDLHMPDAPPASREPTRGGYGQIPAEGPVELTLARAIVLGLQNNRQFHVDMFLPAIKRTSEEEEAAAFDPLLRAEGQVGRNRSDAWTSETGHDALVGVSEYLPTGTRLDLLAETTRTRDEPFMTDPDSEYGTSVDLTITQSLLRGRGLEVNLASLRQARIDTRASEYELRGLAEALTAEIETAYWDHALAEGEADIYARSLDLATRLVEETRERIALGKLARTEIFFAEAEAAVRKQNLINARSRAQTTRLLLLRLIAPAGRVLWDREVTLLTAPRLVAFPEVDPERHLEVALRMRPDINQARLAVERGELEIVKTKNGLLPRLDLFATLGRTGYASTFGGSVRDVAGGGGLDAFAGLRFEVPVFNRKPKAAYRRSILQFEQEKVAVENLALLAEEDVLKAHIEILRARDQIDASRVTVAYQESKLNAEIERYRLGRSTMFRVAQAERDLVTSQILDVQSLLAYFKAQTQFFYAEGTLLLRRGIDAPGKDPVMPILDQGDNP